MSMKFYNFNTMPLNLLAGSKFAKPGPICVSEESRITSESTLPPNEEVENVSLISDLPAIDSPPIVVDRPTLVRVSSSKTDSENIPSFSEKSTAPIAFPKTPLLGQKAFRKRSFSEIGDSVKNCSKKKVYKKEKKGSLKTVNRQNSHSLNPYKGHFSVFSPAKTSRRDGSENEVGCSMRSASVPVVITSPSRLLNSENCTKNFNGHGQKLTAEPETKPSSVSLNKSSAIEINCDNKPNAVDQSKVAASKSSKVVVQVVQQSREGTEVTDKSKAAQTMNMVDFGNTPTCKNVAIAGKERKVSVDSSKAFVRAMPIVDSENITSCDNMSNSANGSKVDCNNKLKVVAQVVQQSKEGTEVADKSKVLQTIPMVDFENLNSCDKVGNAEEAKEVASSSFQVLAETMILNSDLGNIDSCGNISSAERTKVDDNKTKVQQSSENDNVANAGECLKDLQKMPEKSSKLLVQAMSSVDCGNITSCGNMSNDEEGTKLDDTKSKVVVQVMPTVDFGSITALQQCITESRSKISQPEIVPVKDINPFADMKELLGLGEKTKHQSDSSLGGNESLSKYAGNRRIRKNHELNFHIRSGQGVRLSDIDYIVAEMQKASPLLLRTLHYVLYGTYGMCNNENVLSKTKKSILYFSGFPFPEDAEIYQKKRKCLSRMPYLMLSDMGNILLGKAPRTRDDTVEDLICFLMKPSYNVKVQQRWELNQEEPTIDDLEELKEQALQGPSPVVLIPKLSDSYVQELLKEMQSDVPSRDKPSMNNKRKYIKPPYVIAGPGSKLKSLTTVAARIHKARRRIVNLLHCLLYYRPGSDIQHRMNILEFSGFPSSQSNSQLRRRNFLGRLKNEHLEQMCDIFSLRVKSGNKTHKIEKLLQFLDVPSSTKVSKKHEKESSCTNKQTDSKTQRRQSQTKNVIQPPNLFTMKLRDFERIRSNIECSPPEDLIELNDLLFLKPCDVSDIHEKILEFTQIPGDENTFEFHSRRTLLHYMSFEVIKKIAYLLDITDFDMYSSSQDLATDTLKFLLEMKPQTEKKKRLISLSKRKQMMNQSFQEAQRPHLSMVKKDEITFREKDYNGNHAANNHTFSSLVIEQNEVQEENSVVIHRISESSYSFISPKTNEPLTISDSNSDEALSLCEFIHHPTEKELEVTIKDILCTDTWMTTMGDLINKVFLCYPKLNLSYRIHFIKAKALEIIHEMQRNRSIDVDS